MGRRGGDLMDWAAVLALLVGGGLLTVLGGVVTKLIDMRIHARTMTVETDKVELQEKQLDGTLAEQVGHVWAEFVQQLQAQHDAQNERILRLEAEGQQCRADLATERHARALEVAGLQEQITRLQAELWRYREGHVGR